MSITVRPHSAASARRLPGVGLIFGAAVTVAACGASATTSSPGSSPSAAAGSASTGSASNAGATTSSAITVSAKSVSGLGTVLVNQEGQTLYMLTTEKGGKITCTESNGCLHAWPETNLSSGVTVAKAGSGVQSALLGSVKGGAGQTEVTYNGWPLYTFIGDSSAGMAKGQGISNFGGTWYVLNASGNPVTTKAGASSSSSSSSGSSGGYGY